MKLRQSNDSMKFSGFPGPAIVFPNGILQPLKDRLGGNLADPTGNQGMHSEMSGSASSTRAARRKHLLSRPRQRRLPGPGLGDEAQAAGATKVHRNRLRPTPKLKYEPRGGGQVLPTSIVCVYRLHKHAPPTERYPVPVSTSDYLSRLLEHP
jgi:hypothetical protein